MPLKAFTLSCSAAVVLLTAGCAPGSIGRAEFGGPSPGSSSSKESLTQARKGFVTHLSAHLKDNDPLPRPPASFRLVYYQSPVGKLPALITPPPQKGPKRPAILWISGGFDNSIDDTPWKPATPDNDQSARAFPEAGITTMYPAFRGGNSGPGNRETLYGEVADAIAAANYLAAQPGVDPHRIYLGGHSTGGTLALLIAESTGRFRAVFAFGPVSSPTQYGPDNLPFDLGNPQEVALRSPILYLGAITSPTFVFEGTDRPSNLEPVQEMMRANHNPQVHFYKLPGYTHFSELAPITPVIAQKIVADTGAQPHFSFLSSSPEIDPADR